MKNKVLSVQVKILLMQLILPVLVFAFIALLMFQSSYSLLLEEQKNLIYSRSESISDSVNRIVSIAQGILSAAINNPDVQELAIQMDGLPLGIDNDDFNSLPAFDRAQLFLNNIAQSNESVDLVFMTGLNQSGVVLGSNVQLTESFDVRGRDYYQAALQNPGKIAISAPRISAEDVIPPKMVGTVAMSIPDENGNPVGVLAFNYSLNTIADILRLESAQHGVSVALYDTRDINNMYQIWALGSNEEQQKADGVFYDPDQPLTLDIISIGFGFDENEKNVFLQNVFNESEYYTEGDSIVGDLMLQFTQVGDTPWKVMIIVPRIWIVENIIKSLLPIILGFIIIFTVIQIFGFILIRQSVLKPLSQTAINLGNLAKADADLTLKVEVKREDEIGKVNLSFNEFIDKLRVLIVDIKSAISAAVSVKDSVTQSTEETSTAIEEISANLDSIGKQIDILDDNISENVTAIEEITKNIESFDQQIINQSAMVEQSTAAITQMIASLNNVNQVAKNKKEATKALSTVADEGKSRIDSTSSAFKIVTEQIQSVQEMATTINNIAAQTNLLSMNAAIEAAHAGDAGRGFAVVAEEIRKLADSAGQSSQKISQLIKDITLSVDETDKNVLETAKVFDRIMKEVTDTMNAFSEIEHSVDELNTGGQQILESTNEINEVTVNIKQGSSEIKFGTESMSKSSVKIKEVSDRVTTGMAESTAGAGEIVRSMQLMVGLSQELESIISELESKFGQFKT